MASLMSRLRSAASSVSSSSTSSAPSYAASSSADVNSYTAFVKKHLFRNPVMTVSVILGTVGLAMPIYTFCAEPTGTRGYKTGRLQPYLDQLDEAEAQRRDRILHDIKDIHGDARVDALRESLHKSPKYQHPQ